MSGKLPQPLGGPSPAEVSLSAAPLVRVLAQGRFPDVLKIDAKDTVAGFQEEIREDYPLNPLNKCSFRLALASRWFARCPAPIFGAL